MYEVYVILVVMFEKVNVKVKFCEPYMFMVVVYQVVKITCIGFTAGVFAGTRTVSATSIMQAITTTLIPSCLFKSILSRCCV
jgi:hypothetical protein